MYEIKILYIYSFLAATVVAYYKKCYDEFSVCLITNTNNPYGWNEFKLTWLSANDWCNKNSSSLAIIENETVQNALAFIKDSSAKLGSDVITNGHRSKPNYWEWTNGRSDIDALLDSYYPRYAYLRVTEGRNATLRACTSAYKKFFICSYISHNSNCPDGHLKLGIRCYKIHTDKPATWFDARNICLQEESDLATFEDNDISSISRLFRNEEFWVGLRNEIWYWLHDKRYVEMKYSNWDDSRPSAIGGDCLCLTRNTGKWKDCDCSREYRYICIEDYASSSSSTSTSKKTTMTPTTTTTQSTPATISAVDDDSRTKAEEKPLDNSGHILQNSEMLLAVGLGIACLLILIVVVAVVFSMKIRRSGSHDPGPSHDAPSTTTLTKDDPPTTVYAEVMPSEPTRSPSEKYANKIIYAELELAPKGNKYGTSLQEPEYDNCIQQDSVYANCANTRV